ncbi:MAG: amidohydrolase [Armatimonadetes bacterium]|nr:amidohydrolase [Armatimonadota bacterium]
MLIDCDTHVSSRGVGFEVTVDQLLRHLDEVGVQKAVCFPMVSYTREISADNRAIFEGAKAHPDRIIAFGGVNPRLGLAEATDELRRCIEVYGVSGIKMNGARDGYYIDDPVLSIPLIDRIAEAGIVLAVHCGANDFEKTHPYRIAKISERHPDLRIMVVHMGGSGEPNMHDAVIDLAARYPNWYLVDSEASYRKVHLALERLGPERICYGSDTPFAPMRYEWGIRQVVYQDLSEADKAKVFGENAGRLFGLR